MAALPFALSATHFVNSVGADAGFAAIIGLALLAVLYFAQARETRLLRDQATEADDRLAQLELRVAALTRAQARAPTPDSVSAAASVARSAANPSTAANPSAATLLAGPTASPGGHAPPGRSMYWGAPAGVGAPALTAATRLIPGDVAQLPQNSPAELAIGAASSATGSASSPHADASGIGLGPATAAGGANGVARESIPRTAPAGTQTLPPTPPRLARRAPHGGAAPAGRGRRRRGSSGGGSSRSRRGVVAVLGALAVVATVAVVLIVTSGPGSPTKTTLTRPASQRGTAPKTRPRAKTVAVNPALVTVAVLNGTATANLAHTIGSRLAAVGFQEGKIVTAADQTQTTTVVGYLPGHRNDALAVATTLKLRPSSVAPVNQANQALACPPPPAPCPAAVVVTVGTDLAAGA